MNTPLRRALWCGLAASIMTGCSGFNDEFKAAMAEPAAPGRLAGAWDGSWQSDSGDHGGPLRAVVKRVGQTEYNVRYSAGYKCLGIPMTFEHETTLRGNFAGSTFHFEGDADLGLLPGVYKYTGYATPDEFYSTYTAKSDHGTYTLRRPSGSEEVVFPGQNIAPPPAGGAKEAEPAKPAPSAEPAKPGKGSDGQAAEFKDRAIKALSSEPANPNPAPTPAPQPAKEEK